MTAEDNEKRVWKVVGGAGNPDRIIERRNEVANLNPNRVIELRNRPSDTTVAIHNPVTGRITVNSKEVKQNDRT